MAQLRLEQLQSNLSYNSGSLAVSGSLTIVNNTTYPISASLNTSGSISINIVDGGTY